MHVGDWRLARCLIVLPLVLAIAVGGCGGGSTGSGTAEPTASTAEAAPLLDEASLPETAPLPPPTRTPPLTITNDRPRITEPTDDHPVTRPGGDDENVRVPARFVITPDGRLKPKTMTVPAYLTIELSLLAQNTDGHYLSIHTVKRRVDALVGRRFGSVLVPGMRPGRYQLEVDYRPAGTLIVGGEAGP
jgi:hypothetical protein